MTKYTIHYELEGKENSAVIDASDPGHAFRKCEKAFPGCVLLGGFLETWHPGLRRYFSVRYEPPSQVRILAETKPKMIQGELPLKI